jgi:hypothetical protein
MHTCVSNNREKRAGTTRGWEAGYLDNTYCTLRAQMMIKDTCKIASFPLSIVILHATPHIVSSVAAQLVLFVAGQRHRTVPADVKDILGASQRWRVFLAGSMHGHLHPSGQC